MHFPEIPQDIIDNFTQAEEAYSLLSALIPEGRQSDFMIY
jgi:hypothetical protein